MNTAMSSTATSCIAVIAESWKEDGRLSQARRGRDRDVQSRPRALSRRHRPRTLRARRSATATCSNTCASTAINLGGEQSGHIILSDYTTTGDGLVAALQVLAVVQDAGQAGVGGLPPLRAAAADPQERALQEAASRWKTPRSAPRSPAPSSSSDGHGRLVIRPSGTEPVIRVMGEGDDTVPGRRGGRRHRRGPDDEAPRRSSAFAHRRCDRPYAWREFADPRTALCFQRPSQFRITYNFFF